MTFVEDWFCAESCEALADLYRRVAHLEGDIVEVGCWEGRSTVALANACEPSTVHAVDTWQGSPGEISEQLAAERDVFAAFRANVAELTAGNVKPYRMGWRHYFAVHAMPTRFLHIDATHTYDEVRGNIEAALPLMVPGAVICGDDAQHPPVHQAVVDLFPDAGVIATLWWVVL